MTLPGDETAFFAAGIEETRILAATTTTAPVSGDGNKALTPGRWLIQVIPDTPTSQVWITVGAYDESTPQTSVAGAGRMKIPLGLQGIIAHEYNVRAGYNDALAAICSAGTATVYLSRVSRKA